MSRMKTVTNQEFLFKLMNEYKYFKNKKYTYEDKYEDKYEDINEYKTTQSSRTSRTPYEPTISPKQLYELEVPLSSYIMIYNIVKTNTFIYTCEMFYLFY